MFWCSIARSWLRWCPILPAPRTLDFEKCSSSSGISLKGSAKRDRDRIQQDLALRKGTFCWRWHKMFIAVFALQTSFQGPSQSFRTHQCLRSTWKGTEVLPSNGAWRCGYLPKWPTRCCKSTVGAQELLAPTGKWEIVGWILSLQEDPPATIQAGVDQPKNACLCLTLSCRLAKLRLGSHSPELCEGDRHHVNGEARRPPSKEARPEEVRWQPGGTNASGGPKKPWYAKGPKKGELRNLVCEQDYMCLCSWALRAMVLRLFQHGFLCRLALLLFGWEGCLRKS